MKFVMQRNEIPLRVNDGQFYLILLSVLTVFAAFLAIDVALVLHRNFLTIACDTAAFQSSIVNTTHGHWFRDTAYDGPNILGQHSFFVFLLIAPIYTVFPSPETLFVLQIIGVYSTVISLYLVAHQILGRPDLAFLVSFAALISPFLFHLALSPFHPETWILSSVLLSYLFYLRNFPLGFWLSAAFSVCCGEQASFIYIPLGVALLTCENLAWRKKYGWWSLILGIGWFVGTTQLLFRFAHSPAQTNVLAYHYSQWAISSSSGLVEAVGLHPLRALETVFDPRRWLHVLSIVGLPLVLALFSWRSLILLAAFPVFFLMCDQEFYLYFHAYYYSFAFLASYLGMVFLLARPNLVER
jgi:uncharacterized membrane protein